MGCKDSRVSVISSGDQESSVSVDSSFHSSSSTSKTSPGTEGKTGQTKSGTKKIGFKSFENFTIVFLKINLEPEIKAKFDDIVPSIIPTSNCEECVSKTNQAEGYILLVLTFELVEEVLSCLDRNKSADRIFILDEGSARALSYPEKWQEKVVGPCVDMNRIYDEIKSYIESFSDIDPITVILNSDLDGSSDVKKLDPSFMYTQLLKEILLEKSYTNEDIKAFVEYMNKNWIKQHKKSLLTDFERGYTKEKAINWYTKESFLYNRLNAALRESDAELLVKLGFYIRDLHESIEELQETEKNKKKVLTLFRGQGIDPTQLQKLMITGSLIAFNSFLSTTIDKAIAKGFLKNKPPESSVLFIMNVERKNFSTRFAYINDHSDFKEKEYLFSMHSIFRVTSAKHKRKEAAEIHLELTDESDPKLQELSNYIRKEIGKGSLDDRLQQLLIKMGSYVAAEDLIEKQRHTKSVTDYRAANINNQLGFIKLKTGDHKAALEKFQASLQLIQKTASKTSKQNEAEIHSNIGSVYLSQSKYDLALEHFEEAEKLMNDLEQDNQSGLSVIYNNIAAIQHLKGHDRLAIEYFEKTLELQYYLFTETDPRISTTLKNMGKIHLELGEEEKAIKLYEKSAQIEAASLQEDHPERVDTYQNLTEVYARTGREKEAERFRKKIIEYEQRRSSQNSRVDLEQFRLEVKRSDITKDIEGLRKVLEEKEKSNECDFNQVANMYDIIGEKLNSDDRQDAREFYEKALQLRRELGGEDSVEVAKSYEKYGDFFQKQSEYQNALDNYMNSLEIRKKHLLSSHQLIRETHRKIGSVFLSLKNYSQALFHYETAYKLQMEHAPKNGRQLATYCRSIVHFYQCQNEFDKAIELQKQVIEHLNAVYTLNKLDLSASHHQLGFFYQQKHEYKQAIDSFSEALRIERTRTPLDLEVMSQILTDLAITYHYENQHDESIKCWKEAITNYEQIKTKKNSVQLFKCYQFLGTSYRSTGKLKDANESYEKALKCLEDNSPDAVSIHWRMSEVYKELQDASKELKSLDKLVKICETNSDTTNDLLGSAFTRMGSIYHAEHNYNKSISYFEKAVKVFEQQTPKPLKKLSVTYKNMGADYEMLKNIDRTIECYKKALELQTKSAVADEVIAETCQSLCKTYMSKGGYAEALPYGCDAVRLYEKSGPEQSSFLAVAYCLITEIYVKMEQYDKSIESGLNVERLVRSGTAVKQNHLSDCYFSMASSYEEKHDIKSAIKYAELALETVKTVSHPNKDDIKDLQNYLKSLEKKVL